MLTERQIQQFQELLFKHIGKYPSQKEAVLQGVELVNLMRVVYGPLNLYDFERMKALFQ